MQFLNHLCSNLQHFKWRSASRGPSATAKILASRYSIVPLCLQQQYLLSTTSQTAFLQSYLVGKVHWCASDHLTFKRYIVIKYRFHSNHHTLSYYSLALRWAFTLAASLRFSNRVCKSAISSSVPFITMMSSLMYAFPHCKIHSTLSLIQWKITHFHVYDNNVCNIME